MAAGDHLRKYREQIVKEIATANEMIEWLSDPDIVMKRTEVGSEPEDLKAILLADHHKIIENGERHISMIDGMLAGRQKP